MKKLLGFNVRVHTEAMKHEDFKRHLEIAKRADEAGLYYLGIFDFFQRLDPNRLFSPSYMAAIATVTEHVKFGPYVMEAPLLHPVHVADMCASLDIMSNGRFIMGVGLGFLPLSYDVFNIPWKERGARLDEALDIMKKLWTQPVLHEYRGRFFTIKNAVTPPCVQKPHVPIWVGGGSEASIRRTAQYGNEWAPGWMMPEQAKEFAEKGIESLDMRLASSAMGLKPDFTWEWALDKLKEYCEKFERELVLGRPPKDPKEVGFNLAFTANINPDKEKAIEETKHFWVDVRKGRTQGGGSLEMKLKTSAIGKAEEVIEKINECYKIGAYLVVVTPLSIDSMTQWDRIEKEVLPSL